MHILILLVSKMPEITQRLWAVRPWPHALVWFAVCSVRSWRSSSEEEGSGSCHRRGRVWGTRAEPVRCWSSCCSKCPHSFCSGAKREDTTVKWLVSLILSVLVLLYHYQQDAGSLIQHQSLLCGVCMVMTAETGEILIQYKSAAYLRQ